LKRQELKGFHHTSGDLQMILKFITKNGTKVHGPPYTKKEEADFYGRNANGPVTVASGAGDRKERKSQAPQHPSPAKRRP
jgi:hypothetical protein